MDNSQIRRLDIRSLRRHAVAVSFAAILIIAGGIAHALAQDAEDDDLPDVKFLKGLLTGLGLKKDGEQSGIEYQERAPLVVPPTRDLPLPQTGDPAQHNAAWPQDQDEQRRKTAAARRKKESATAGWLEIDGPLRPSELRKTAAATPKENALKQSANSPLTRQTESTEGDQRQATPAQLGYTGGLIGGVKDFFTGNNKTESVTFESEPPRVSLTDPPTGYRSPSPAQLYGVGPDSRKPKATTQEQRAAGDESR